jgi:hypothetical protein
MDKTIVLAEAARPLQTQGGTPAASGGTDGDEFITFREAVGERVKQPAGRQVRLIDEARHEGQGEGCCRMPGYSGGSSEPRGPRSRFRSALVRPK